MLLHKPSKSTRMDAESKELNSRLLQLTPFLLEQIALSFTPRHADCRNMGETCSEFGFLATFVNSMEVNSSMLRDVGATDFLERYKLLIILRIRHQCEVDINLSPLMSVAIVSRLRYLHLTVAPRSRSKLLPQEWDVITGLKALEQLHVDGFEKITTYTEINLQCMVALRIVNLNFVDKDEYLSPPHVRLMLPLQSRLNTVSCPCMFISGEDLTQLTFATKLECATLSEVLDLRSSTHLEHLGVYGSNLTSVDISGCAKLVELSLDCRHMHDLKVQGCTEMRKCHIPTCALTSLPFQEGKFLNLEELGMNSSKLINAAGLPPSLLYLFLNHCRDLIALDVTACKGLRQLHIRCCDKLTELPGGISDCPAILESGLKCNELSIPNGKFCMDHTPRAHGNAGISCDFGELRKNPPSCTRSR